MMKSKKYFPHGRIIFENGPSDKPKKRAGFEWHIIGVAIKPVVMEILKGSAVMTVLPEFFENGCPHSTDNVGYCTHTTDGSAGQCDSLDWIDPEGEYEDNQHVCIHPDVIKMFTGVKK